MAGKWEHRIYVSGPDVTQWISLAPGDFTIGRQADCNLTLKDVEVSRRHVLIRVSEADWQITDLGSANGTMLDGVSLRPHVAHALAHGSRIQIGPYTFRCEEVTLPAVAEPPSAPDASPPRAPTVRLPAVPPAAPPLEPPPASPLHTGEDDELPALPDGIPFTGQRLLSYLPGIYHSDFMAGFLAIFEATLAPIEWTIDNFDLFLDPRTAPTLFLPWLAKWYALTLNATWSAAQCRALLQDAHQIFARSGTRWALSRALEIYTGRTPEITDQGAELEPFTFIVKLPLHPQEVNEAVVSALIDDLKPAYTSYRLVYAA